MTSINLAAVYQSRANYPEALDFLQQALVILREEKERYGEAVILNNMGEIYRGFGQARHALSYFEKARSLFDAEGDRFAVGIAVANIGAAYDALGEYSQALEFYQEALAIDALESLRPGLSDRNKSRFSINIVPVMASCNAHYWRKIKSKRL
jgi:tetratricopeptide (TPR) repeat protein